MDTLPRDDMGQLFAATSADIDAIDWVTSATMPGVSHKVLWQSGDVVLGIMRLEPGAVNPEHVHHAAHHHILLLSGQCHIAGKDLVSGSYIYIPPGVPHGVEQVGPDGVEFFYTYRPVEVPVQRDRYSAPV